MRAFATSARGVAEGYVRYRGREGQLSFLLHRFTGLGILLYLIIHILDTSTVFFIPSLYNHAIATYRSVPFLIGEIILVFAVIFHGLNGLRLAWFDMLQPERWSLASGRSSARWTLAISFLIWLPAALWMVRHLVLAS